MVQVQVGLAVVEFHPGSRGFVAQSKIESQGRSDAPVVLTVSGESPCKLVPGTAGADTLTGRDGIASEEIRCRITAEGATEEDGAVLAAVATVEGVDAGNATSGSPLLNTCLPWVMVTPSSNWITVSAKFWSTTLLPTLVRVPCAGRGSRTAAKAQQQQARTDVVGVRNSQLCTQVTDAGS